ncbi:hypothetical protein ACTFIR_011882 [Dictyostelium discoideum]
MEYLVAIGAIGFVIHKITDESPLKDKEISKLEKTNEPINISHASIQHNNTSEVNGHFDPKNLHYQNHGDTLSKIKKQAHLNMTRMMDSKPIPNTTGPTISIMPTSMKRLDPDYIKKVKYNPYAIKRIKMSVADQLTLHKNAMSPMDINPDTSDSPFHPMGNTLSDFKFEKVKYIPRDAIPYSSGGSYYN